MELNIVACSKLKYLFITIIMLLMRFVDIFSTQFVHQLFFLHFFIFAATIIKFTKFDNHQLIKKKPTYIYKKENNDIFWYSTI